MSVSCPHCGFSNPEGAGRCVGCGEPLAPLEGETRKSGSRSAPDDGTTQVTPPGPEGSAGDRSVGLRSSLGDLRPGDMIGDRYRILELVGSGGMGEVYRAEQVEPIRRQVALKVIKLGMDTKEVVARFEGERQALALMEHTNIARVFDAGATPTGRPYFVMEYVRGEPITEYCDRHNLSTEERLQLVRTVCDAVQHAHQKGIIHRDLKPSNVLVTVEGDTPVPKIIDFGIAKATGARLTEATLFTSTGELMGTPEYMSPEQAEMSGLDVDTRTDIYSLGVMLYELLVGALPFDPRELRKAAFGEIRRIIRETDPPRPSTRFSELGEKRETIARCRRTDPAALAKSLKGDLEWMTLKAMEKDRTRRYASASELAADIERHLRHQPIEASPPSRTYRMKKYIRRHRTGVTAAALIVLVLIAGIVGTTAGLVKARRAERAAEREAATARQVSDFLVDMFEVSDPAEARGEEITAREILERGTSKIDTELADQPKVRTRLLRTMGKVYGNLALYDRADPLLESALAISRREFGEDSLEAAAALHELAGLREREGRYRKALGLAQQALSIRKLLLGEQDPLTASTLTTIGGIQLALGQYDDARVNLRRSLELHKEIYGEQSPETAEVLQNLANLNNIQGRYAEAERLHRRALGILEKAEGKLHPDVVQALSNIGLDCYRQNKLDEARDALSRGLELAEKLYGDTHTVVGKNALNLGLVELDQGHLERAEALLNRALDIFEQLHGAESLSMADALEGLGNVQSRREAYKEALPLYKRCLEIREVALGPEHERVAGALSNIGVVYCLMGELRKGKPFLERSLRIREKALGPEHQWVAQSLGNFGLVCMRTGELEEADRYFKRALEIFRGQLGNKHPNVTSTLWNLAAVHWNMGDFETARSYFEKAVAVGDTTLPPRQFVHLLRQYAGFLQATGEDSRADEVLARAGRILADQGM